MPRTHTPLTPQRSFYRHIPVLVAVVVAGLIYGMIVGQQALGPRLLIPGLMAALMALSLGSIRMGKFAVSRIFAIALLGVVTIAEAISTAALVAGVLAARQPQSGVDHAIALTLLRDAGLVWVLNIITFALWYWEVDSGGPTQRHRHGYQSRDFIFPQVAQPIGDQAPWMPHFIDYMFLSFTTSTAFSPTDTPVLSVRAKLLVMAQSLISLVLLAIIAARAVNTL